MFRKWSVRATPVFPERRAAAITPTCVAGARIVWMMSECLGRPVYVRPHSTEATGLLPRGRPPQEAIDHGTHANERREGLLLRGLDGASGRLPDVHHLDHREPRLRAQPKLIGRRADHVDRGRHVLRLLLGHREVAACHDALEPPA